MIQSFADNDTKQLFLTESNRRFAAISRVALRKLIQMNQAGVLQDLAVPPGNRLEALKGTLSGYHSIRSQFGHEEVTLALDSVLPVHLQIDLIAARG